MHDQVMNAGIWPMWLQQAVWLEWLQLFLYGLLAIAVISLVITLLDLAMLCWKEFHSPAAQETTSSRTASVSAAPTESAAVLKKRSLFTRALLLLLCGCHLTIFAREQSPALNTALRDGEMKQVKPLPARGAQSALVAGKKRHAQSC